MLASAAHAPTDPPAKRRTLGWIRLVAIVVIVASLLLIVRLLPVDRLVSVLSQRVEQMGMFGPIVFGVVYVLAAVLFVPGSALTLAAGAIFGLVKGTIIVSIASTTAAAISFLIGRYAARRAVQQKAAEDPRFAAIDRAIGQGGWKIIALLRLSPAIPFSLGNYLFGLTPIRFWPHVLTSSIAMLPGTFLYVYLGVAGRAGLNAAAGAEGGRPLGQWVLLVVGLLATVVVTVYVTRLARKAIREQTELGNDAPSTKMKSDPPRGAKLGSTVALACLAVVMAGCTGAAYRFRSSITGLFGPPTVTLAETYAEKPGPRFDHAALDEVLKAHVDAEGQVDYAALKADTARLDAYIASLAAAPINEMGRNERLALLINAYNAFTLRLIVDHYPVKSIKDIPVDDRWKSRRWTLGGEVVSLDQIEHEMIRPHFKEPRIHFALVCAAKGCPPLRTEAYRADDLESQLDAQARYVHARPTWFGYDARSNELKLTSLYDWFAGDFQQVAGSPVAYAARYSDELKRSLDAGRSPRVTFLDYDWSLNVQEKK